MTQSGFYNASTLLDARLEAGCGARIALYFGDERITYDELHGYVCAMGRALQAWGVARENRVLMILSDTPAFPIAFFGAMRIGAVPAPVNPLYKASDYRFFLEDSGARVVIADASCLDKLNEALREYAEPVRIIVAESLREELAAHAGELAPAGTHHDDMAFWL